MNLTRKIKRSSIFILRQKLIIGRSKKKLIKRRLSNLIFLVKFLTQFKNIDGIQKIISLIYSGKRYEDLLLISKINKLLFVFLKELKSKNTTDIVLFLQKVVIHYKAIKLNLFSFHDRVKLNKKKLVAEKTNATNKSINVLEKTPMAAKVLKVYIEEQYRAKNKKELVSNKPKFITKETKKQNKVTKYYNTVQRKNKFKNDIQIKLFH